MHIEGKISKKAVTEYKNLLYEVLVMILISEISPESCCFANFTVYSISRLEIFSLSFVMPNSFNLALNISTCFHTYKIGIIH